MNIMMLLKKLILVKLAQIMPQSPIDEDGVAFNKNVLDNSGLTASNVSVDSKVIKINQSSNKKLATTVVEVTTEATLKADKDTYLSIVGKQVNELHSSAIDYHEINLARENPSQDFTITGDQQLLPDDASQCEQTS